MKNKLWVAAVGFAFVLIQNNALQADNEPDVHDIQDTRKYLEDNPKYEWSPIFWAVRWGNLEEVQRKVEKGADLNERDFLDRTPLHIAVVTGHLDVVKYLVDQGADAEITDKWDVKPLDRLELLKEDQGWDMSRIEQILEDANVSE